MKERLIEAIGDKLDNLEVFIDEVIYETEGKTNYLRIVLDSKEIIDLKKVTMATRIMNPIIDKMNLEYDEYILDVYAKSKGEEK
ncbi:MAG: hypothetical protein PHQ64_01990 [Bacilli bacterium]|nr:hypothetical protein [Bacilli bacterium]